MNNMEHYPQLIIIPDEDYEYGINHGAYPEFQEELSTGDVIVLSRDKATTEYGIATPKDNKVYVRNVFNGAYIDISAENTEKSFIEAKAVALREVLVMLGAFSAELEHTIEHKQDKDLKIGAKGKKGPNKGSLSLHQNKHKEVNLEAIIRLKPFNRSSKSAGDIRQYAFTHGLGGESTILAWIDRLERDGKLEGSEEIEVSFLEELSIARDAALNLKLVQCEVGFNIESLCRETHHFVEKISIDFGDHS
ncbi:MAG: hypothetical protein IKW89_02605 [Bacteroidales bacterium]|nr:hypothetical protein [Bacteroidales bacterium]